MNLKHRVTTVYHTADFFLIRDALKPVDDALAADNDWAHV